MEIIPFSSIRLTRFTLIFSLTTLIYSSILSIILCCCCFRLMCVFVQQLNCFWVVFDVGMCEGSSQSKILWLLFKTVWVLHKNCEFSASSCISVLHLPTVPRTLSQLPRYRGYVYISPLPASCHCPLVSGQIGSNNFNLYIFFGPYLVLEAFGHLCGMWLQAGEDLWPHSSLS